MSNNPITKWIKAGMEPYAEREAGFKDRVAETAINAVRIATEYGSTTRSTGYWKHDPSTKPFNRYCCAHSTLKSHPGGINSSHQAMEFYIDVAEVKRDQMLVKIKAELAESSSE